MAQLSSSALANDNINHHKIDLIDGAKNINKVKNGGSEALTDLQTAYPIVYPQKIVTYITDDTYAVNHPNVPYIGVGDLLYAIVRPINCGRYRGF